ncbi:MAG: HupE/UreJ family protein [Paracoccaceae bacterium]
MTGTRIGPCALATAFVLLAAGPALAHSGAGVAGGLQSGLAHPLLGLDHLVAMVAVGLWGAFLGRPAIWLLPVVFPLVMALGAALGIAGMPLPMVEAGIALSGVVLGLVVLLAFRAPLWVAAVLVGLFAIFHGHAHGTELPEAANPLAYAAGFIVGTGLLHAAGILLGYLTLLPRGDWIVRAAGGVIALVGLAFLFGMA